MQNLQLPWQIAEIQKATSQTSEKVQIEIKAELPSTNSEIMRRIKEGELKGETLLLIAETQTAGRGRLGKKWQSTHAQVGDALTYTLAIPLEPKSWEGLSLAVGLSLAKSLGEEIQIKWPNDLLYKNRKLAGILIETANITNSNKKYAVIGIGINIGQIQKDQIQSENTQTQNLEPAWLQETWQIATTNSALIATIQPLITAIKNFEKQGFAPLVAQYEEKDALKNKQITITNQTNPSAVPEKATAIGIAPNGALITKTQDGKTQTINSAEISIKPEQNQ